MTSARSALYLSLAMALAGVILITTFAPRAGRAAQEGLDEPTEERRTHIVVVCPPGEPCRPRGVPVSKIACDMDLRGVAIVVASGTRTKCERVTKP
ncbi:hypothetical protein [Reyranella sp.]|jgi:hypothetical protein|uniref:hypothetical protein n=1 Tax=Reyranella sp. TaxID=1929291 RepID=UPI000BCCD731|nr:hypothetical protein [Reyranella sp.]OYY35594.1 MAG: hypothetical protein B7Y57_25785 [Rhodospirillales bacterium 35-66-84]OYZ91464.1 MAG: hypothetical protein B7Y08_25655 [Rhodospirillales bacterium 24-66-33]OZB22001.1 MAG: hypothetical protein B7X63_24580 [Rhodospirillales bacterium 39-66-50]HQS14980.1 hypothetical protein [Reyranella sp.]HQT10789.1 hypothetical protein [Reyranella sp.]